MSGTLGGVQTPTVLDCPACGDKVIVGKGHVLRVPQWSPNGGYVTGGRRLTHCHETVDPHTGVVFKRGGYR